MKRAQKTALLLLFFLAVMLMPMKALAATTVKEITPTELTDVYTSSSKAATIKVKIEADGYALVKVKMPKKGVVIFKPKDMGPSGWGYIDKSQWRDEDAFPEMIYEEELFKQGMAPIHLEKGNHYLHLYNPSYKAREFVIKAAYYSFSDQLLKEKIWAAAYTDYSSKSRDKYFKISVKKNGFLYLQGYDVDYPSGDFSISFYNANKKLISRLDNIYLEKSTWNVVPVTTGNYYVKSSYIAGMTMRLRYKFKALSSTDKNFTSKTAKSLARGKKVYAYCTSKTSSKNLTRYYKIVLPKRQRLKIYTDSYPYLYTQKGEYCSTSSNDYKLYYSDDILPKGTYYVRIDQFKDMSYAEKIGAPAHTFYIYWK